MRKIFSFLKSICLVIGALVMISGVVSLIMAFCGSRKLNIEPNTMLMIDFSNKYNETAQESLLDELLAKQSMSLRLLIEAIETAKNDENISGIVARIDISDLELAQIQEVAAAIANFRESGKKTVVFSQGFGPLGQGNREYYLASFFEKIYMQPHTFIGLTGISMELPFARNLLNKIGIYPEFYSRYEYKTAMMNFTEQNISATYKQEMQRLGSGLMTQIKTDIINNRELKENIDNLINMAPISAENGVEYNLVDELLYLPELEEKLKAEGIENFVDIEDYAEYIVPNSGDLPTVAVLNLNGIINSGENAADIDGEFTIGSKSVLSDISKIADLDNLKAVVVRINSPGGSYNAADEIYFALQNLKKEKNIPIVVSQGGYAASGGYFISLAGDIIVAEPMTITGSIGVVGGKFVLQKLWNKLGINWADIKIGNNSDILSMNKPFSAEERKIFENSLDEVYQDFTAKVEENRKLTQSIDKIARGRVWTGKEALELGLVDVLGGFNKALNLACINGNIPNNAKIKLVNYPRQKTFADKLRDLIFSGNVSAKKVIAESGFDISYLKLFRRLQYDSILAPFKINM